MDFVAFLEDFFLYGIFAIPGMVAFITVLLFQPSDGVDDCKNVSKLQSQIPFSNQDYKTYLPEFEYFCKTEREIDYRPWKEKIPADEYIEELKLYYEAKEENNDTENSFYTFKKYPEKVYTEIILLAVLYVGFLKTIPETIEQSGFVLIIYFVLSVIIAILVFKFIVVKLVEKKFDYSFFKDQNGVPLEKILNAFVNTEAQSMLEKTAIAFRQERYYYQEQIFIYKLIEKFSIILSFIYAIILCI